MTQTLKKGNKVFPMSMVLASPSKYTLASQTTTSPCLKEPVIRSYTSDFLRTIPQECGSNFYFVSLFYLKAGIPRLANVPDPQNKQAVETEAAGKSATCYT